MENYEIILFAITGFVIIFVLYKQFKSYFETRRKIMQLSDFFPNDESVEIIETTITRDVINSKAKFEKFLNNIPLRKTIEINHQATEGEEAPTDETEELKEESIYVSLIKIKTKEKTSSSFKAAIDETNAYLCKNAGSSADFQLLQDICERKTDALETLISNSLNVPLYWGLVGTFAGIIVGLIGIAINVNMLFDIKSSNLTPLQNLLFGVGVAMVASSIGLLLMIRNSAINYKNALVRCNQNRTVYYDFLRRELMPVLSSSMASSLNSLKSVLGDFVGKFGNNLKDYVNSAELLNMNIEQQHLLLVEVNQMKQKEIAVEIAQTFNSLNEASNSLEKFRTYQESLNGTIQNLDSAVSQINNVILSFDDFTKTLNLVVNNQAVASELQKQFRTSIETHFPTGSEARQMWRKNFDELTEDAKKVSKELTDQFSATTLYIKDFAENNKDTFESLSKLQEVLRTLVEYTNVQAQCYKDLKHEIQELKKEQTSSKSDYARLNADLLTAVREMIMVIKTFKN